MDNFCYSVYVHTSPSGKRYVGITRQKPETRWGNGKKYSNNKYFAQAIKKYGWASFEHKILASELCQQEAEKMERELIARYNSTDRECGYNVLCGGDVHNGGWHHTEESKGKIGKGATGRKMSEAAKQKISAIRSKAVCVYDINGNFINEFKSVTDAEHETGVCGSNISGCCKGKYGSMQGYIFRYADGDTPVKPYYGKWRAVCQYTLNGEYVKTFPKISDAADEIGVDGHHITNACKFKMASSGGYLWLYENEQDRLNEKINQYKTRGKPGQKKKGDSKI